MNWKDLKKSGVTTIAGVVSGGLDSCTATHWLSDRGFKIEAFTVDLGQPDEEHISSITERMLGSGASHAEIVSGEKYLALAGLKVIQSQARYEGDYWNTTGIARPITIATLLPTIQNRNIDVIFHGATGRGNDQVRLQLATNMLSPNIKVYAPWRDPEFVAEFPGRQQMLDYCAKNQLPIKSKGESRYSTDANFLGLTHEAGDLENVEIPPYFVNPGMGVWPWNSPDEPKSVAIRWEKGVPKKIDNVPLDLISMFKKTNSIGGAHGVGIGTHVVENRFVGVKSRGIYEAPGLELLGKSFEYLLQFILDRRATELFNYVSKTISSQIYQGYWLDLTTTSLLASLEPILALCTGTIVVRIYKGNIYFESAEDTAESMPHSLYTDDSSMEAMGSYDHEDSEGFLKILGISAKNVGARQFPWLKR